MTRRTVFWLRSHNECGSRSSRIHKHGLASFQLNLIGVIPTHHYPSSSSPNRANWNRRWCSFHFLKVTHSDDALIAVQRLDTHPLRL